MDRKDFLQKTGLVAGLGMFATDLFGGPALTKGNDGLKPVLLDPLPPLEHNGGLNIRTRIRSEMTGGIYSSVETAVAPRTMGPPPHHHKELDELMYVLEGTASVLIGEDIVEVKAGGWHLRPRLIQHTFWNAGDSTLRFIDMYFNQDFEKYLERIFFELTEENGFQEGSAEKMRELNILNEKYGVVFPETSSLILYEIKQLYSLD